MLNPFGGRNPVGRRVKALLSSFLNALSNLSGSGFVVKDGNNVFARELIQGTGIIITDGDGVSDNPTISLDPSGLDEVIDDRVAALLVAADSDVTLTYDDGSNNLAVGIDLSQHDYGRQVFYNFFGLRASYFWFKGFAGNDIVCPDLGDKVTGDIDVRVRVFMNDWTPTLADNITLMAKMSTGANRSWRFEMGNSGTLHFSISEDGSAENFELSSASPSLVNGTIGYLRVTVRLNNGSGNSEYKFYQSPDGVPVWTQIGTTQLGPVHASIFAGGAEISVGASFGGTVRPWTSIIYLAEVYDGIDGTLAFSCDARDAVLGGNFWPSSAVEGDFWTATYAGTPDQRLYIDNSNFRANWLDWAIRTAIVTNPSSYAANFLSALLTVDGSGSGLDADLLDGNSSAAFALSSHNHSGAEITSGTVAAARLGTGTPTAAKVLVGDGAWKTLSAPPTRTYFEASIVSDTALSIYATIPIPAGTRVEFKIRVHITSASTPDFKYRITAGGTTPDLIRFKKTHVVHTTVTAPTLEGAFSAADVTVLFAAGETRGYLEIDGIADGGVSLGSVQFEAAQNTSSGTTVLIEPGSYIEYQNAVSGGGIPPP